MAVRALILVVAGVAGGATAAQFPEYVQQYTQRLGGAVDELASFVAEFDAAARAAGLTRGEALAEYAAAGTPFLAMQGGQVAARIARYERLLDHKTDLENARPFERLYVFARDREADIAERTLDDFAPAIPTTSEGLTHAAGGFLAAAGALWLLLKLAAWPLSWRRRRQGVPVRGLRAPEAR